MNQEQTAKLYEAHYMRVFSYAMTLTGNREMAEDVTQDVFVKLLTNRPSLEEGREIAEPDRMPDASGFSGQFERRIPRSLHRTLSLNAKKEGISMNQYCIYLLSKNDAVFSVRDADG